MSSFIDSVSITVVGGNGGAGVASFEKRRGKPRGKPNGGSGGPGGDVLLRADDSVASLIRYERQPHWRAGDGTHGEGELRLGRAGDTATLPVPLGTLVRDEGGTLLADLVVHQSLFEIAAGKHDAERATPRVVVQAAIGVAVEKPVNVGTTSARQAEQVIALEIRLAMGAADDPATQPARQPEKKAPEDG